jgi:hypothetical protein
MSKTKHTPGPWEIRDGATAKLIYGTGMLVASVPARSRMIYFEANARLIKAEGE